MLYQIFHEYDVDGGFGDPISRSELVAVVDATQEQIDKFLEEWDKPRIYDHPYGDLYEHGITVKPLTAIKKIEDVTPYDPETRDWPDLPDDCYSYARWTGTEWKED
jgi:hypothetical protein